MYLEASRRIKLDLYVNVLTTTHWPNQPPQDLILPQELQDPKDVFTKFYSEQHRDNRRIQFQYTFSTCVLKASFAKGAKELSVSLHQALVLLLFNRSSKLSFVEIRDGTRIDDKDLRLIMQSLACSKTRVLTKIPASKDVADEDEFVVNDDFTFSLFRVKINQIQARESPEEQKATEEKVMEDRQYQIDAAIVRIMKARKKLTHQELVTEAFSQLRFQMRASDLKKRIESLIEREYLERDAENAQTYHYLA
jgi:cullin-4